MPDDGTPIWLGNVRSGFDRKPASCLVQLGERFRDLLRLAAAAVRNLVGDHILQIDDGGYLV